MNKNLFVRIPFYKNQYRRVALSRDEKACLNQIIELILAGLGQGYSDFVEEVAVNIDTESDKAVLEFKVQSLSFSEVIKVEIEWQESEDPQLDKVTDYVFDKIQRFLSRVKTGANTVLFEISQLPSAPFARQGR